MKRFVHTKMDPEELTRQLRKQASKFPTLEIQVSEDPGKVFLNIPSRPNLQVRFKWNEGRLTISGLQGHWEDWFLRHLVCPIFPELDLVPSSQFEDDCYKLSEHEKNLSMLLAQLSGYPMQTTQGT